MNSTALLYPLTGKPTESNYRNIPVMCRRVGKGQRGKWVEWMEAGVYLRWLAVQMVSTPQSYSADNEMWLYFPQTPSETEVLPAEAGTSCDKNLYRDLFSVWIYVNTIKLPILRFLCIPATHFKSLNAGMSVLFVGEWHSGPKVLKEHLIFRQLKHLKVLSKKFLLYSLPSKWSLMQLLHYLWSIIL